MFRLSSCLLLMAASSLAACSTGAQNHASASAKSTASIPGNNGVTASSDVVAAGDLAPDATEMMNRVDSGLAAAGLAAGLVATNRASVEAELKAPAAALALDTASLAADTASLAARVAAAYTRALDTLLKGEAMPYVAIAAQCVAGTPDQGLPPELVSTILAAASPALAAKLAATLPFARSPATGAQPSDAPQPETPTPSPSALPSPAPQPSMSTAPASSSPSAPATARPTPDGTLPLCSFNDMSAPMGNGYAETYADKCGLKLAALTAEQRADRDVVPYAFRCTEALTSDYLSALLSCKGAALRDCKVAGGADFTVKQVDAQALNRCVKAAYDAAPPAAQPCWDAIGRACHALLAPAPVESLPGDVLN